MVAKYLSVETALGGGERADWVAFAPAIYDAKKVTKGPTRLCKRRNASSFRDGNFDVGAKQFDSTALRSLDPANLVMVSLI